MDGVLNINKPEGISSFDAVRYIKKISKNKKVGHAGTLDPAAAGVLPICIGKATKIIDNIMNDKKAYTVELKLGVITDTYDREGKILSEKEINCDTDKIVETILSFKGESYQVPPMYSALKVNGKKLYELARKGIEIEREQRKIVIHNIDILEIKLPIIKFNVACSKGTYMRSLCYDIGELLGCGGMMNSLVRISSSSFHLHNSINLYDLNEDNIGNIILPIEKVLEIYDKITVNEKFTKLLCNGVKIYDRTLTSLVEENKLFRVYDNSNRLLGLGVKINGTFKIINLLI